MAEYNFSEEKLNYIDKLPQSEQHRGLVAAVLTSVSHHHTRQVTPVWFAGPPTDPRLVWLPPRFDESGLQSDNKTICPSFHVKTGQYCVVGMY